MADSMQKQREAAEKIFKDHLIDGDRIHSLRSFRRHVTRHEYPVIALFLRP